MTIEGETIESFKPEPKLLVEHPTSGKGSRRKGKTFHLTDRGGNTSKFDQKEAVAFARVILREAGVKE